MIETVNKIQLPDGRIYSGSFDTGSCSPLGGGKCHYPDGSVALGTFVNIPNGVAYINYDYYMQLGFFTQGHLQGWGMEMGNGSFHFGVYHEGRLVKDCTSLLEWTHEKISSISGEFRSRGIPVRWGHNFPDVNEVFFGISDKRYKNRVGVRFRPTGDVYIGVSAYTLDLSGTFLHIIGNRMESGVFEKGILTCESRNVLCHSNCWVELLDYRGITFNSVDLRALEIANITSKFMSENVL